MAIFIYRAIDRSGNIIKNKIDDINKYAILKKLKENKLIPISVDQVKTGRLSRSIKKQKRNKETNDSVLKAVRQNEMTRVARQKRKQINERCQNKAIFKCESNTKRCSYIYREFLSS